MKDNKIKGQNKKFNNPCDVAAMAVVRQIAASCQSLCEQDEPASKVEKLTREAKIRFMSDLLLLSIQTEFTAEELLALLEFDNIAEYAWIMWNDIKCPMYKLLTIIGRLNVDDNIREAAKKMMSA